MNLSSTQVEMLDTLFAGIGDMPEGAYTEYCKELISISSFVRGDPHDVLMTYWRIKSESQKAQAKEQQSRLSDVQTMEDERSKRSPVLDFQRPQ